jgi:hypothetical protein
MKRLNVKFYTALLVLAALFSACSGPAENSGAPNAGAPSQQANSNSAPQAPIAETSPPAAAPTPDQPKVQQIPPPPDPAAKPAAAAGPGAARAPKLVAPEKKLDFGKQPQDKSLVRAISIKNGGRADLNIESVAPS